MSDESFVSVRNSDKGPQRSTLEELAITWALLIVTVVASYLIQRNHMGHIIPPSAAAMVLGMIFGWSVSVINASSDLRFSPGIFLYGLLPPIVFAAGFNLNKKDFFQNFGAITLFAVVGTVISTLVFGMGTYLLYAVGAIKKSSFQGKPFVESLLYGALVSAIDPVATLSVFSDINAPPLLYNLVFGESVLNDAVAIVLFRTLKEAYHRPFDFSTLCYLVWRFSVISIGSIVIGVAVTLLCALVLKQLQLGQQNINRAAQFDATVYEVSLVLLSAYMAYIITEAFNLSGIVALFFAGICHAHYTFYNVSKEAGISIRKALDASAFLSETFVFAYLGLQVATFKHKLDAGLLLSALPLCLLSRAANIFPLAALVNTKRRPPLAMPLQIMQWACGLRGAVAYALAVFFPRPDDGGDDSPETQQDSDAAAYPAIETTTLFIVVASTLLFGTATAPLMRFLGLQDGRAGEGPAEVLLDSIDDSSRSGGTTGPAPPSSTRLRWRDFDRRYLKPLFGGQEGPTLPAVNLPATHSLGSQGSIAAGTTPLLSPGSLADPAAADSGANDTAGAPTGLARVASGMERQALQMQSLD